MNFQLQPARDLAALPTKGMWRVTGGRPMFELVDGTAIHAGWYLVTTDFTAELAEDLEAGSPPPIALRFLAESGSVPLARRPVPVIGGRRTRVVHIPVGTARIQLDVSPWSESISAGFVSLRPIPSAVAAAIMSADVTASALGGSTDRTSIRQRLRTARASRGNRAMLAEIAVAYEHLQLRRSGDGVDYPSWRLRNATVFDDDEKRLRSRCEALPGGGPSISVVMAVFDPDLRWLDRAIMSVRDQTYEKWQLCLVDDASTNPEVLQLLDRHASQDPRILVVRRDENGHIAAATNSGLACATGEFVAFMDHDDELAPFALAVVALEAATADVLYTDEDKIDEHGKHYDPHCKPTWNPELLLGQNYLSHLTVIRRSVIHDVGGLREGFDGAQDHDLILRVTAITPADRIRHIPVIGYHWRATPGSTALAPGEKSYTEGASLRALRDRLGEGWTVGMAGAPTAYRCTPPLGSFPLVSIIIPTRDRVDLLAQCIDSLVRTTYPSIEILVVDNDSTDPQTLDWLETFDNGRDRRVVPAPGPFNYSAVNNVGVAAATGELILLLNNDTEVIEPDWLAHMVRWLHRPGIGAVGAKLLYADGTIQHAGVVLGLGGLAGHGHLHTPAEAHGYFNRLTLTHEVGAVTGACLLTWRSTWELLGGLDEELAVAFNDVDYCMRVRHEAGQRVLWVPDALLYHHESVSRGAEDDPAKVSRFNAEVDKALSKWGDRLGLDPAYSPNLTLEGDSFTLARQPRYNPPWAE